MSNKSTLTSIGQRLLPSHEFSSVVMKRVSRSLLFGTLIGAGLVMAEPLAGKPNGLRPRQEPSAEAERARQEDSRIRTPDEGERRHHARLSPEERRALRQHINEAGQDLYPEKKSK